MAPTLSAQAVERAPEALFESDLRLPAEFFTRACGVEHALSELTEALRRVLWLETLRRLLVENLDDLEHGSLLAETDVDRPGGVAFAGAEVRVHHVVDIDVVARLLAVAEDHGLPAVDDSAAEDRDDAGLAERVLARAVDVAVAERDGG